MLPSLGRSARRAAALALRRPLRRDDAATQRMLLREWHRHSRALSTAATARDDDDDVEAPARKQGDVWRLVSEARPEAHLVAGAVATIGVTSSIALAFPWAVGQILDASVLLAAGSTAAEVAGGWSANELTAALLALFGVQGGLVVGRNVLVTIAGERVVQRLRRKLFRAIMAQEVAFFDAHRTGELINRLSADTQLVQKAVTSNVVQALRSTFTGIGGVAMMVTTSPSLTGLVLLTVPPIALGARWFGGFIKTRQGVVQDALAQAAVVSEEAIANVRTVRAFSAEAWELKRYEAEVAKSYDLSVGAGVASAWFDGSVHTAFNGAIVGLLYYGGGHVAAGTLSAGDLAAFMMYASFIGLNVSSLSTTYSSMMRAVGASSRIFEIVDRAPLIPSTLAAHDVSTAGAQRAGADAALRGGGLPALVHGDGARASTTAAAPSPRGPSRASSIVFENVDFAYPSRPDIKVLDGFSLTVDAGSSIALVGTSGCGKSTAIALLMRLYDPSNGARGGRVFIDGDNIGDADGAALRAVREKIAVVNQEPALFAASIRDNIRYGSGALDASEADVAAAARAASASKFIADFPDGLDTLVGERGVQLSGGQKQRVAIARAIVRKSPIVLLDEATSALDAESEHLVVEGVFLLLSLFVASFVSSHSFSGPRSARRARRRRSHGDLDRAPPLDDARCRRHRGDERGQSRRGRDVRWLDDGHVRLCTVTFYANHAHTLTRSP